MRQFKIIAQPGERDFVLNIYLAAISKFDLLTPDEEIAWARQMKKGGKRGKAARDRLVCCNLRFVVSGARQDPTRGMTIGDLTQEGNAGLIKAAEKYDETRGFKFISYAVWWIRQSIQQAISEKSEQIRLPQNVVMMINKIRKATSEFEQSNQRRPSAEELSKMLDIQPALVENLMKSAVRGVSMDAPLSDDEDRHALVDTMPSGEESMPDEETNRQSLHTEVENVLQQLGSRESEILKMSYGIGRQEMTLDEIGTRFGLSRERVRQIREKALRRLQSNGRAMSLRGYL